MNEICALVSSNCWSQCQGQDNPADIPSRGIAVSELATNKLWWNGPTWAVTSSIIESKGSAMTVEYEQELATRHRLTHNLLTGSSASNMNLEEAITCEQHSTLSRLLRVIAYVLRFIRMLKSQRSGQPVAISVTLEPEEVTEAERLWIIESDTTASRQEFHRMEETV